MMSLGPKWHIHVCVRFTTCPKHKGKETLSVQACRTAPSLNPNMKPQKNKARPKRPQFFFTGIAESCTASRALVRLEQEAH